MPDSRGVAQLPAQSDEGTAKRDEDGAGATTTGQRWTTDTIQTHSVPFNATRSTDDVEGGRPACLFTPHAVRCSGRGTFLAHETKERRFEARPGGRNVAVRRLAFVASETLDIPTVGAGRLLSRQIAPRSVPDRSSTGARVGSHPRQPNGLKGTETDRWREQLET